MIDNTKKHSSHEARPSATRWWQRRWVKIAASLVLAGCIVLAVALEYVVHNAAPILRKRVIQTLSERFNAPVELDSLDISLVKGVEVSGSGLRIPYGAPASPATPGPPRVLIAIDHFRFHATIDDLLHGHAHIGTVLVDTATLDLPVGEERSRILGPLQNAVPADPEHPKTEPKIALLVDHIICKDVKLIIEVADPKKQPHEFDIQHLVLDKTSGVLSYDYRAELINPIPRGQINATGHLGPWNTDNPRETPINGDYTFTNADLSTIKGLGGTLSSTGRFDGVLERITADGTTDTPDFSLDISDHPLPLRTKFHAYVDGTTGDTTLDAVDARIAHSNLMCRGTIQNLKGKGHDIALDVVMPDGRIEDVLELGMKAPKPLMRGGLAMKTKLHIPPGKVRVAAKLELAGVVSIHSIVFTNTAVQDKLDGLSMRAQGKPKDVSAASHDGKDEVQSELTTNFALTHGQMTFQSVRYSMPGALLLLDGAYSMDGDLFEFKGHVRTDAKASQMVTGWKSILLKPVDHFLSKDGAGVELPISISGAKNDVHFGLAFKDADETPAQMQEEIRARRRDGVAGQK